MFIVEVSIQNVSDQLLFNFSSSVRGLRVNQFILLYFSRLQIIIEGVHTVRMYYFNDLKLLLITLKLLIIFIVLFCSIH